MNRKRMLLSLLMVILICILVVIGVFVYNNMQPTSVVDELKYMQVSPNHFIDVDDSIAVHSAEDVSYSVKEKEIYVYYGKKTIQIKKSSLTDKEFMQKLKDIGIEVWLHEDDIKVTYWGEDLVEWAAMY